MRLTTRSKYGIRLLLDIALHGRNGPVRSKDMATRQDISKKYLEKLLLTLKNAGVITSKPGPGGGHALNHPPEDIALGSIIQLLDGGEEFQNCNKDIDHCPRAAVCLFKSMWQEAWDAVIKTLDTFTLADLIRDAELCPFPWARGSNEIAFFDRLEGTPNRGASMNENQAGPVVVPSNYHGQRLDKALVLLMPGASLRDRRKAWERGWVVVNGYARDRNYRVKAGQKLDVVPFDADLRTSELEGARVIKEHGSWMAMFKPEDMPCASSKDGSGLTDILTQLMPGNDFFLLNHLEDEETGLVLAALDAKARDTYLTMDSKNVTTTYYALVNGHLETPRTIKFKLDDRTSHVTMVQKEENPTFLRWSNAVPVRYLPSRKATLVLVQLHKGARHQPRAHLAAIGHPVVGDALYGKGEEGSLYLHLAKLKMPGFEAECDPEWPDLPLIPPE